MKSNITSGLEGQYPPDKQEKATLTVIEQAELLGEDWAAYGSRHFD